MNIFILNAGRSGSLSFIRACQHISNYSAGHESRLTLIGEDRLAYPDNHIEADNRLSWMLGRLDQAYGNQAFYVHLKRDSQACAQSFVKRRDFGIMQAYREGVLLGATLGVSDLELAQDYLATVEANIAQFLKDKRHWMEFRLEHAKEDFHLFWLRIQADGELDAALAEWDTAHNAS